MTKPNWEKRLTNLYLPGPEQTQGWCKDGRKLSISTPLTLPPRPPLGSLSPGGSP